MGRAEGDAGQLFDAEAIPTRRASVEPHLTKESGEVRVIRAVNGHD